MPDSYYQHGVAVAVEPVFVLYCVAIGLEDEVAAGKCADQHQEGGAGKVEVGDQGAYYPKLESGIDEQARG